MSTIDNRSRTFSLCMSIDGFVRNERFPKGYTNVFMDNGRTLTPAEARTYLALEKAKGRKVIPMSAQCGNPCQHADNGCAGFDYSGGGCAGRFTEAAASQPPGGGEA
ncbi:MAG: hypothetical protein EOP24_26095 [Hyphomicrobiales bacterium]|nr:MAG: hypothetical protein EOP24_26095 [Hyphomicrobiales bacterium]